MKMTRNNNAQSAGTANNPAEKWENLTIRNRFIFAKVMRQKENALPLLQRLFPELGIVDVRYIETEKSVEGEIGSKGVRFDVYIKEQDRRAFTLEMQVQDTGNLPMRSRYYSTMMDEDLLSAGSDYEEILPAYVIFICPFDLFGEGLHRYTFCNICEERPSLRLGDGSVKVFLNTRGRSADVPQDVLSFLKYVEGTISPDDDYIRALHQAVQLAKKNNDWRREYMNYEMEMKHERKMAAAAGRAEGLAEGRAEGLAEGRTE